MEKQRNLSNLDQDVDFDLVFTKPKCPSMKCFRSLSLSSTTRFSRWKVKFFPTFFVHTAHLASSLLQSQQCWHLMVFVRDMIRKKTLDPSKKKLKSAILVKPKGDDNLYDEWQITFVEKGNSVTLTHKFLAHLDPLMHFNFK